VSSTDPADNRFMEQAIDIAISAAAAGEVPVGALVVIDGSVAGSGRNDREGTNDPTAHAEIVALRAAAMAAGSWRLPKSTVYVTLEPCLMCAGAILNARVARVVYGAMDPKGGAMGSLYNLAVDPRLNHELELTRGVAAERCGALLSDYFHGLRGAKPRVDG
jgi:tRNA(adenine34) deaminase